VPDTVAPLAGAVRLTVGAVVSSLVRDVPAFTCVKADGAGMAALATSTVTGADNCMVDVSARAR
jgi:hypothetical protein